jgi:hypothetical protein
LEWLAPGPHGDALAGDLIEQYRDGRSKVWYWRQALLGIVVCLAKDRTLGAIAVLASLAVLLLTIVSVSRHSASLGSGLFSMDITLLSGYGAFSIWGWRQRRPQVRDALATGAQTGMMLGFVLISSHAIEWFGLDGTRTAQVARGAGSTLLMVGLLGTAGSAAWEQTRSVKLGVIAGLWCGSIGTMILLAFALTLNLAFEAHSAEWLREAFAASGMRDPGAFVVRNALEGESEILVRVPVAGLVLSLIGTFANAWIMRRSRKASLSSALIVPILFAGGAISLWYADSLQRSARPPFVMAGVFAAGLALCSAHAIWSSLSRKRLEAAKRS